MVTIPDLVECPITNEIDIISFWIAKRRILYEYPEHDPAAFGEYDESHIPIIQKGIIGELITFDYLHSQLDEKFGMRPPTERWNIVKDRLCLQNHIGCFDEGSDLTIKDKTVDVKTYHERHLRKEQIIKYNLFVNVREVERRSKATDFYIQTFPTPNNTLILAGCHQGLPSQIRRDIPSPAYACPVPKLMPISILVDLLLGSE